MFDQSNLNFGLLYQFNRCQRIIHELLGQLALRKKMFHDNPISVEQMGGLIDIVQDGMVTGKMGFSI
jgi:Asp-tRNA(Asn)/Glu-tRNA(Gln) amidotransferase B subunit